MQPCSQPWYGLIDCVNGMSGESLRAMIVRAGWIVTVVRSWRAAGLVGVFGIGGTAAQPSSYASRSSRRKRFCGLNVAPRPRSGGCAGRAPQRIGRGRQPVFAREFVAFHGAILRAPCVAAGADCA